MMDAAELRSGKGHRDENFPVASRLIHPRHRGIILAFYEFVRVADDIADHPDLAEAEKIAHLDALELALLGSGADQQVAATLRMALAERGLSPRHAQDLLKAFRLDASKHRYRDWDDLIHYCSYSAMPVGRFVLDVHGESRATWPANDALCAALQIINHLQDCGADFRNLDRVYVPLDALAAAGAGIDELGAPRGSPALLACLHGLARRTDQLLRSQGPLSAAISDLRLALEVSIIEQAARRLVGWLQTRDPLSDTVHLSKLGFAGAGLAGLVAGAFRRIERRMSLSHKPKDA